MKSPAAPLLATLLAGGTALAQPGPDAAPLPSLRFVAATNNALPIAQFDSQDRLVAGIAKELGELIAQRLGRTAMFVPLPSKRVSPALAAGQADAVCFVLPEWLQGDFRWTRGLIPEASLIAAHAGAPDVARLGELANQPLGTVLGYNYPRVQAALGSQLQRNDVPSMAANLKRLAAGRVRYAIVEKTALQYFLRENPGAPVRAAWEVDHFDARCAFSPRSAVPFAEVIHVLDELVKDGSIEQVLARYR